MLKALALGADSVLIGKAFLYGLACEGQAGVERVVDILNEELQRAMILTGCLSVQEASREILHTAHKLENSF